MRHVPEGARRGPNAGCQEAEAMPRAGGTERPAGGRPRTPQGQPRVPDRPPDRPRAGERAPEDRHRPPLRRMRRVRTAGRRYDDADRRGAAQLLPRLAPRERKPPARRALQPRADGAQTGPQII